MRDVMITGGLILAGVIMFGLLICFVGFAIETTSYLAAKYHCWLWQAHSTWRCPS